MRGERTHSAGGGPRGEEGVMSLGEEVTSRERGRGMASLGEGGGRGCPRCGKLCSGKLCSGNLRPHRDKDMAKGQWPPPLPGAIRRLRAVRWSSPSLGAIHTKYISCIPYLPSQVSPSSCYVIFPSAIITYD